MDIRKFYGPEVADATYGYGNDEVKQSPFNFGLNAGVTKLTKFGWIPNGGKAGAEQEALEIVFNINGTDKSYRKFPIVKAFKKDTNEEVTDPNSPEMKEAFQDFNATVTHILHSFQDSDTIKAAFSRPISSFKEFCQVAQSILPPGFENQPLDIFLQFQWQLSEGQDRTYLDIPGKMKYGKWLCPAQPGTWTEQKAPAITADTRKALWYVNEEGVEHPFTKNGWFMTSNFANQQRSGNAGASNSSSQASTAQAGQAMNAGTAPASKSAW